MPYTTEQLDQLIDTYREWTERRDALATAVLVRAYASDRARELATHGLSRRLATLQHCLDRTFECVPPDAERPVRSDLMDATAFIQTFMINVFGALDNLAHIWCLEAAVRDRRGRPLAASRIGLMPKNEIVRRSLSPSFQAYLAGQDEWFEYLESYRHALAHRIPPYIPPRQLDPLAQARFAELEVKTAQAGAVRDWEQYDALQAEIDQVGVFEPYLMHSFGERARPVRLHGQLICDLATVVEIGERVAAALDALKGSQQVEPKSNVGLAPRPPECS